MNIRGYNINIVGKDRLSSLKDIFDSFAAVQHSYNPWHQFAWYELLITSFGLGDFLHIIEISKNGMVVALVPLMVKREKFKNLVWLNKVLIIGNHVTPINNFIICHPDDDNVADYIDCILEYLYGHFRDWSLLQADGLAVETATCSTFERIVRQRCLPMRICISFKNAYIDNISCSGDEYMQQRSKNTKNLIKKKRKRIEEKGKVRLEVLSASEEIEAGINAYYLIREKSWKAPDADSAFNLAFWRHAVGQSWLKVALLYVDETPVASLIALIYNKTAYLLETNYDEEYFEFSPGQIIHHDFIKFLIDVAGVREINTLRGAQTYKKSWFPQERDRLEFMLFNKDLKGRMLNLLINWILPLLKYRPRLGILSNNKLPIAGQSNIKCARHTL
jgi:CelD/BcsL family acetyltransferase involved in cellulose biosynthesis